MKQYQNVLAVAAAFSLLALSPARADDKDVVEYRQHLMKALGEQAAILGQIVSTAVPSDNVVAHLDALSLLASTALKAYEP